MEKVIDFLKMQRIGIVLELKRLNPEGNQFTAEVCASRRELLKEMPEAIRVLQEHLDK
jgi:hypothetical protein